MAKSGLKDKRKMMAGDRIILQKHFMISLKFFFANLRASSSPRAIKNNIIDTGTIDHLHGTSLIHGAYLSIEPIIKPEKIQRR